MKIQGNINLEALALFSDIVAEVSALEQSYSNEQALVDHLLKCLGSSASPWGEVNYAVEFGYQRGRTDVVALANDGFVIAFEAKLIKWREALHQAYRNTCFAHFSYIVLPKEIAEKASHYYIDFQQRGIGLCYISDHKVIIVLEAAHTQPLQPWLSAQAAIATWNGDINAATSNGEGCSHNM